MLVRRRLNRCLNESDRWLGEAAAVMLKVPDVQRPFSSEYESPLKVTKRLLLLTVAQFSSGRLGLFNSEVHSLEVKCI